MGTRTSYEPGTFCWVDLSTPDPDAAKAFYSALLGWEIEDLPGPHGNYSIARVGGEPVAALVRQVSEEIDAGVPPHWNSYVSVESADETVARAEDLGANAFGAAFDVGEEGRIGVFRDPVGAATCVWQAGTHFGAGRVNEIGCLTWNELGTAEVDRASEFYTGLFGWAAEPMDTGGGPAYVVISVGERSNGGIREQSPEERAAGVPSSWMPYFAVESTDESVEKATRMGGRVLAGPMDIGNGGRIAALADPQGAAFAFWAGPLDD